MQTKLCPKCKQRKDAVAFSFRKNGYLRAYCKACEVERQNARERTPKGKAYKAKFDRENRKKKPDRYRNSELKQKYGITVVEWNERFEKQGKACAVCRRTEPSVPRRWETDHCHKTKKFRGVLCGKCNSILGFANDNPAVLVNAALYLLRQESI